MSTTIEEDYIENLSNEILDWCETLVEKGRHEFKQSECKEKFIVVMEAKVVKACEFLCAKSKLHQDPSSRRIIIYKIDADFIVKVDQKIAEKASVAAPAVVKKAPTPKAEKTGENVLKPISESKKNKASDQSTAGSVKKQKLADVTGLKKISSFFAVQPKAKPVPQAPTSNDENTEPSVPSSQSTQNTHTSHASHYASHAPHASKACAAAKPAPAPAPAPKPQFTITVEEFTPLKPEPPCAEDVSSGVAITEEMVAKVCKLIVAETDRRLAADNEEQLLVQELLGQLGEDAQEEELRVVLQRLEGQNKIMVDEDTIYVV